MIMKWFFDESGITIVGNKTMCILRDHPQYLEIKAALLTRDFNEDTIFMILDPEVIKARKALLQEDGGTNTV